jgi:hypothetical protein
MSSIYFMQLPETCYIMNTEVTKWCIPPKLICGITPDGIVTLCGDQYNCNLCCGERHEPYYVPYDGINPIEIQTQFFDRFNPDPTNPVDGFGTWITVDILDANNNVVGDHTDFGIEYFVGWNGTNSYQILRIYPLTTDFPTCWSLKYHVYRNIGGDPEEYPVEGFCTQDFKIISSCENGTLYTLRGVFDSFDCEGNYYDLPTASTGLTPFKWNNTIQVLGYAEEASPERETVIKNGIRVTESITYKTRITFPMIPLFMVKYLEDRIFSGRQVYINDELVTIEIDGSDIIEGHCVYNYSIFVINKCETNKC